jgi:hypothetical protein
MGLMIPPYSLPSADPSAALRFWFTPLQSQEALGFILATLAEPGEIWLAAFAFTHPRIFNAICDRSYKCLRTNLIVDHSQSKTADSAPLLNNLHRMGVNVIISCSPAGRDQSQHRKAIIAPPLVIESSANFTQRGFLQSNVILAINSESYAAASLAHWRHLQHIAATHAADWKLPGVVAV